MNEDYRDRLINFFNPWLESTNKAGSYEYAIEVQDMLMADGFVTQITKDGDWYYCEPINE